MTEVPWRAVLVNSNDGSGIGGLTAATQQKFIWNLVDTCTVGFTLPGTHPPAADIIEGETDLKVYDPSGTLRFRGRMGSSTDTVSPAGHVCQFGAVDYRGFLQRRILWPGNTQSWVTAEQVDIAWQLIEDTQSLPGGDLGITRGSTPPTGVFRTLSYDTAVNLGTTLSALASLSDGFEWEIDENLRFNTYYPSRGSDPGITLAYGPQISSVTRTVDTSTFANAVYFSGDSSLTPITEVASDFGPSGRWEAQVGDTSILDLTTLTAAALAALAQDEQITPSYQVVLNPKFGWTPDLLWLGDTVRLIIKSGRLDVDATYRVTQVEVDPGDEGGEVDTLTLGPVILTQDKRLLNYQQRISNLERV